MYSKSLINVAVQESRDEITASTIYKRLASREKNPKFKKVFLEFVSVEYEHYKFWIKYTQKGEIKPDIFKVYFVLFLRYIMGAAFVIKYLEKSEAAATKKYESIRKIMPKSDMEKLNKIILEEEEHEHKFAEQVQGTYVKYISFVVLGLADALVEIAGIHAGSLGIYDSTELTGLAGIVAGAAASIAMASAAYAQAKQGFKGSASLAAAYTGISYFASAVLLATPYFLTGTMLLAIVSSIIVGMVILAVASWYNSIISGSKFRRDFLELAGIMLAATVALFFFGLAIRNIFHIGV